MKTANTGTVYENLKKLEVNFSAPCVTSPCQNNGYCVDTHPDPSGYHCMCQPPYDGPLCETRQNPCVWPQEPGLCNNTVVRYYYDRFEEECQPFNYTGIVILLNAV